MELSQISNLMQMSIIHDGEFHSLGLLSHNSCRMLVVLYDQNYLDKVVTNSHISCVVTKPEIATQLPEDLGIAVCKDPQSTFYKIHHYLFKQTNFYWVNFDSDISTEAIVHERAYVAPKNVRIGRGSIVEPNAVILERSIIGEEVVIRSGAVIGGEGFEPKYVNGDHIVVPHAGGVLLHDKVEIQANTHVARNVFGGFTEIGKDTKIDALVQIAHNVSVGCRCEIAASAVIAGSTVIGNDVWIGPNATVSSELQIGNGTFIALGSVVTKDIPDFAMVAGSPARFVRWRKDFNSES